MSSDEQDDPVPSELAHDRTIARVARRLQEARSVLFVTGAGVSADSGLPTYRGIGGLYEREVTEEGWPIEVALSGSMLRANPAVCWKYIGQIEAACRGARPNRAHEVIAGVEATHERCWVLTQNVDGLHRQAGSRNLIEIHGNVRHLVCMRCGRRREVRDFAELELPPRCAACSGSIRPDVVLFGEMLPEPAVRRLYDELERGFDMVFTVGTSSLFPYIAEPVVRARRAGWTTVEINPGTTEVSRLVEHRIVAGAAAALAAIAARAAGP